MEGEFNDTKMLFGHKVNTAQQNFRTSKSYKHMIHPCIFKCDLDGLDTKSE